ncbi:MAG: Rpp14/Pop5 family protein [Promethearchaeota archaeon]
MVKEERQRYIYFELIVENNFVINKQLLLNVLWASIWKYFGMKIANKIGLWLIEYNPTEGHGILRCSQDTKDEVISALTLIREINRNKVIMAPIKTSGTIRRLKKKIKYREMIKNFDISKNLSD